MTFAFDGMKIEYASEAVPVSFGGHHVADPEWSHVDSHGHEHRFVGDDLPTLALVVTDTYWCESCNDEHEETEFRCRQCGDVVEPHWKWTGPETRTIQGLIDARIVTEDGPVESTYVLRGDEWREIAAASTADEIEKAARALVSRLEPTMQTFRSVP